MKLRAVLEVDLPDEIGQALLDDQRDTIERLGGVPVFVQHVHGPTQEARGSSFSVSTRVECPLEWEEVDADTR